MRAEGCRPSDDEPRELFCPLRSVDAPDGLGEEALRLLPFRELAWPPPPPPPSAASFGIASVGFAVAPPSSFFAASGFAAGFVPPSGLALLAPAALVRGVVEDLAEARGVRADFEPLAGAATRDGFMGGGSPAANPGWTGLLPLPAQSVLGKRYRNNSYLLDAVIP